MSICLNENRFFSLTFADAPLSVFLNGLSPPVVHLPRLVVMGSSVLFREYSPALQTDLHFHFITFFPSCIV